MRSSYHENNYGAVLQTAVRTTAPNVIVELGVLDGYSTLHLARGAKWLTENKGMCSHLFSFDLFDDYKYKHGDKEKVQAMLEQKKVANFVTLEKGDAFHVHSKFGDDSVGLLHIDISNDGNVVCELLKLWCSKLKQTGGWVLLEGGSKERDCIPWMQRYSKRKIGEAFCEEFVLKNFTPPMVLQKFPSMTVLQKRSKP
jgi:hypothetical protein